MQKYSKYFKVFLSILKYFEVYLKYMYFKVYSKNFIVIFYRHMLYVLYTWTYSSKWWNSIKIYTFRELFELHSEWKILDFPSMMPWTNELQSDNAITFFIQNYNEDIKIYIKQVMKLE